MHVCACGQLLDSAVEVFETPEEMVEKAVNRQLKGTAYELEEISIEEPLRIGKRELSRKWQVYIPEYDLSYYIWYGIFYATISENKILITNFSYAFLNHFYGQYPGEKELISFECLNNELFDEFKVVCTYHNEDERQKCLEEMKMFCEYINENCTEDYDFEFRWVFQKNYKVKNEAGSDSEVLVEILSHIGYEGIESHIQDYYTEISTRLDRADLLSSFLIHPKSQNPELIGKTEKEIDSIFDYQYQSKDGRVYSEIQCIKCWAAGGDSISYDDIYKLICELGIQISGSESAFSFESLDHIYEFSYNFYNESDGFYYLMDGVKKTAKFFSLYPWELSNILGIDLESVSI